ncbi:MAG: restriction endonuclease subunit M, partial [Candidatus Aenigmarchaeota archaeon]|nr:restriction endonuclease subunit M [Candidatus Aenigmarchaeota archaeon]
MNNINSQNYTKFIKTLGFKLKDGTLNTYSKLYKYHNNYEINIFINSEFSNSKIDYGNKIDEERKTTTNFSQQENFVVLECVNRLLDKGYSPERIILEKVYPSGHGTSGRLDILVKKNSKAYLMIECKTWGNEFDKEFTKLKKDGGQLFTYFQQDTNTEHLVLYTSRFDKNEIEYRNEIIKIEENYRQPGDVKDLYNRWNKLTKINGLFDEWVEVYEFQSKALTREELNVIKQKDSSFIFNRFLEILRQNVVSDKPNAFNKIFTLFLCKIVDEDRPKSEQLHFQWLEGEDDNISFQKRLTDLYKRGMEELLEKEVTDIGDEEFNKKFGSVEESQKKEFLRILTEIRLKKNNEFAFKEVFDDESFEENAIVVKDVVELLQKYQLRYNQKHQYLGDFFELLLTTGLKQESGQFFTPVPVARYIIKSLPIKEITKEKLKKGNSNDLLPCMIDYAAGSGHFLTESMNEVQQIIDGVDENKINPQSSKKIKAWKDNQFDWAFDYVYGIEKDYRLVKTAKVSCYLHGDGLANVIHGDGLGTFDRNSAYRGRLKEKDRNFTQDNKQFDIVISNPPYSVSAFKGSLEDKEAKKDFELFDNLTDQSSEIECLFIERTKQLLKDGGVAGIILPSSILSNTGIYTKTREIILKYFEIIGITQLGSSTFMATGTNTVVLFLRRKNNYD